MDVLRQDLRAATRSLRRSPGFAIAFIVTLGVAIGASASVFSAVRLSLFDPLPYPGADRLVEIWETSPEQPRRPVAPANYLDWRDQAGSFAEMAVYRVTSVNVAAGGDPENLPAAEVSGSFFSTLRPRILAGRALGSEDADAAEAVAVVARDLAIRQFGSVDAAIGAAIDVDRRVHRVVGVADANVDFPDGVAMWRPARDDVPPIGIPGFDARTVRDARYLGVVARLAEGVDLQSARREMDTIGARLRDAYPLENEGSGIGLQELARGVVASSRPMLLALGSSVALLLGVACANIAGLVLARSAERRGEIALRAALGASGARVARQLATELGVLIVLSFLLAMGVGSASIAALRSWLPAETPRLGELSVDSTLLGACLLVAGAVGAVVAIAPGRLAARLAPAETLRRASRGAAAAVGAGPRVLVATQFALAVAVVAAAGLLLSTLGNLAAVEPGFQTTGRLTLRVHLPGAGDVEAAVNVEELERAAGALRHLPGVEATGTGLVSLLRSGPSAGLRIEGVDFPGNAPDIQWTLVDPGYFEALGIPVRSGRPFDDGDDDRGEPVTVINATAARAFFSDGGAIGRRIRTGLDGDRWVRVVGVVGDTRDRGLDAPAAPRMYRPLRQPGRWNPTSAQLIVRAAGTPPSAAAIRSALATALPGAPVTQVRSAGEEVVASFGDRRTIARVGGALALAALALAALGVHSVLRRSVSARRGEIAVRMSIGATSGRILVGVLREALVLAGAGLVLGAPVALATARLLSDLLFGVGVASPAVLGAASLAILGVSVLAAWAPARRAAAIDPMVSLRG